jgi:hypothetical protein
MANIKLLLQLLFIFLFFTGVVLLIIEVTKGNGGNGNGGNGNGGNGNGGNGNGGNGNGNGDNGNGGGGNGNGGNDDINIIIKSLKEKEINMLGLNTCYKTGGQRDKFDNRLIEGDIYINCDSGTPNQMTAECMSLLPPDINGDVFFPVWVQNRKILEEGEVLGLGQIKTLIAS